MDSVLIESQWKKLEGQGNSDFKSLCIDESCPNLYIGINSVNNRCLLLIIPKGFKLNFKGETKENLKTSYNKRNNCVVLELLDNYYHNLFNDLIISLYYKIYKVEDIKDSTSTFITTINKWSDFLAKSRNDKLSKEIIKGLFGELTILNELLIQSSLSSVNSTLNAWQGPYDANTDFVFDEKNIEVKTKNYDSSVVQISSEYQLDDELGKHLELSVVSVESNSNSSLTIELIIVEIRDRILKLNGDVSVLFDALAQKSLFSSNLKDYDLYKFTLRKYENYSCDMVLQNNQVFPRLKKSELPGYISKLRYNINLQELDNFIVAHKIF